ncbi:hypothetical protein K2173_023771 [Erythroxylum novogranatense]|uniref:Uncharacterized protein n=1 Tax=Erythroxylum novogranatense TaxID=1862640 RepID=A0AAV8TK39_9ROSI|nr:hypothetical protein K2173_023771 [Erythroxylum novogranatense]
MPAVIGRDKQHVFQYIVDKVAKRLAGWKSKVLSKASKDILIPMVTQTIPNYLMSLFLLPLNVCRKIETLMNERGGLAYRCIHDFNLALLAKQGCRLLQNHSSLAARVMKGRYCHDSSFWEAILDNNPSYIRRNILEARNVLTKGCYRRIGDGEDTLVWHQPWLPDLDQPYVVSPMASGLDQCKLFSFIIPSLHKWDDMQMNNFFQQQDVMLMKQMHLSQQKQSDSPTLMPYLFLHCRLIRQISLQPF